MKTASRALTAFLLATWSMSSVAQWQVNLTVPLEVSGLVAPVTRVVVMCAVKAESKGWVTNVGEVQVDSQTGRPTQSHIVVSVAKAPYSGTPPSQYYCRLHIAGPPSGVQGGNLPSPSTHPIEDWRPLPGTTLVEQIEGRIELPGPKGARGR